MRALCGLGFVRRDNEYYIAVTVWFCAFYKIICPVGLGSYTTISVWNPTPPFLGTHFAWLGKHKGLADVFIAAQ